MKQYRHSIFSIRKLSIGVVSLCIGSGLLLSSLSGLQVEASERIAKSNQEIHFQYLLEEELSPEEKNRIVQNLPEELRQEATYFVVYRPHPSKVLPVTGEVVSQVAGWLAAGFLLIGIRAISSKKARVTSLLYITISGTVLPVLQIEALQSHALARFNQTVTVKAGDVLPDGKLKLDSYDFVGYIVEEGKTSDANITLPNLDNLQKSTGLDEPNLTDKEIPNSTEPSLPQVLIKYREENIPMEMKRVVVDDSELAIGQERLEAGVAGYYLHRYEESWLGDNLQSSRLIEVIEEVGKPEILHRGTKVEELPEQPIETQVPDHAPTAHPPVLLEYELQERVDQQVLPILEERIETDRLAQGETETVEGQTGLLEITYQDVIVDGKVIASNEVSRTGTPAINRKVYVGTRVVEELPEQPIETQVPDHAPTAQPPVRLEYELQERVDQQVLPILEERIETDRLAQGETETVEGQTGLLEITYQDVIVDGKVIASNEVSRTGTPAINRKVYVGTRVDSKEVEPLTHSIPEAIIVSEEVPIPFEREQRSDPTMAVGTSRVEAGKEGLSREIYAELNGVRTHLKSEEITPAQPEITYVGSAVDEVTEEELPLVERIVELADQYTDYILEVQAGYPGRRKTISRNGEVIRVETEEGQEKIVHIGIKPIEGTVVENLSQTLDYGTVYQADPNLAFGVRQETEGQAGQEVFEVTYRTIKGQKTEEIRRKRISYTTPVDKVITVGTQATEEEVREALLAIYEADDTIPLGQKTPFSDGREKVTVYRTTYVLDEETGQVSSQRDQGTLREAGESPVIRVGTQPKVETLREPLPIVYQADTTRPTTSEPVRQAGRDKVTTITTSYSVNPNTGEVTASEPVRKVTDEGQSTVITVGTQATEEEVREALPAIYEADDTIPLGQQTPFFAGREKVTVYRTTYVLDEETGQVSSQRDQGTLREVGESPIIRVGTQPKVETLREPLPVVYQADTTRPTTSDPVRQAGRDKVITLTTTYSVNPNTGEVTASESVRKVTDEGQSTVITVGTQPTVREVSQTLPTVYRAREDMEPPYRKEVVTAQERRLGYRTNYVVNPQTGERLPQAEESFVISEGRAAIIEVGTKSTVVSEKVPHQVIRQDDFTLPEGEEVEGPAGRDGSITRTTSYRLNEATGELETLSVQIVEVAAQNQVIRVGKKVEEVPPKPLEKPTVRLASERAGGALVVNEETSQADLYYHVTDPDNTLQSIRLEIYNGQELVKTVEKNYDGGVDGSLQVTDLQHYAAYQARLSYRYRTQDGQADETVATLPFEISPKSIEFNRVSKRELFYRDQAGEFQQVTGLLQAPSDLSNYFVRYISPDSKEFLWAVDTITENGNQFDIAVRLPKLVQARDQADSNQLESLDKFQVSKIVLAQDSYVDFQQLIQAMKARPDGTFKLAADLVASPTTDTVYVENFRGRLEGLDGKVYRILNLNKPLFQTMTGARVENILLENVALESGDARAAALAITANTSQIQNVHVTGRIQSYVGAAGLVYESNSSQFDSVSFKGELVLNEHRTSNQITSGGLVGRLMSGSSLRKAYVNLTSTFTPRISMQDRLGGLVGTAILSTIDSVFVEGQVTNTEQTNTLAGLVAVGYMPSISNVASALKLPETGLLVGTRTPLPLTVLVQENVSTGVEDNGHKAQQKSTEELKQILSTWGLDRVMQPIQDASGNSDQASHQQVAYHLLRNGREDRKVAYENMSKLLPFYDRHTIVRMGNKLATDSVFVTKSIQSIVALKDKEVVTDFSAQPSQVNKLLVYFTDKDVQVFDLAYQGAYDQTGVLEYRLGTDLLFTPYQWVSGQNSTSLVATLRNSFKDLDVESDAYATKTKMAGYLEELRFKLGKQDLTISMKQLYLKRTQQLLKDNLDQELGSFLASQWVTNGATSAINAYMQKQVEDNKESIWLALTYLARYYGIDFDKLNLRNLAIYQPHFYGQSLSTLDWLKEVGNLTYKELAPFAAPITFKKIFEKQVGVGQDLFAYLELNRQLFSPEKTDANWFKESSKAFIHEEVSISNPSKSVQVYEQIKGNSDYHRYILPLLNLPEEDQLYLVSLPNVLVFGSYGRYVDHQLQISQPELYLAKVKEIQEQRIPKHAQIWNRYMEFIKSLVSDAARQSIESKLITVREGYNIKDPAGKPLRGDENDRRRWAAEFGDSYSIIDDFFGPTELYYGSFEMSGAADFEFKKYIIYGNVDLLTSTGNSTFTHEMIHILEDEILNLAGRRQGQESESYAMGLLQSIATSNGYYYGFNMTEELAANASHNSSPSRLTSKEDLQKYLKGSFDTTYFLDALEAEEMLKLPKDQYKTLLRRIELELGETYSQNGHTYRDAFDKIRNLSESEWQAINLTKVEDLVTHNLQLANTINNIGTYLRDNDKNYYFVPLYYPIYAGLLNKQGTVGGLQFRRTALELLAEKGWDQGFLPYVSNQLVEEAHANGRALTDSYIWKKLMPDYPDYASFKKARYRASLDQKNSMKPIRIFWSGSHHDLQTGQDIQNLMQVAIQADLANPNPQSRFQRQQLKEVLYKAFHESSQEFKQSIFLP
ncbi:ZmpA/ZmpB/ZmpC family metallo-endopeptidase [Streptococcus suis]|uniref:ZmpA/ZmpB/ZmpC family metallo-endopeptidase n=1 Tax=Streptococcus suis TaxID=1307 RepID=UPI001783B05C|nr:ZmpA/ZmpB/ZmpC family metallo-endopeptidase [Streptococcus suis]